MAQGLETEPERGKADVAAKWSDGALDGYEKLTQGTHTLTVIATDKSGNSTEKNNHLYRNVRRRYGGRCD